MRKPFYFFIGSRYTRLNRKNHFISFISMASMIGIALGVMVLITVLSVMNGFSKEIRATILNSTPHLRIRSYAGDIKHWHNLFNQLNEYKDIKGAAPFTLGQGLIKSDYESQGVLVRGIIPEKINSVYPVQESIIEGNLYNLKEKSYGIIISRSMSVALNVGLNEKLTIFVPEVQVSLAGVMPRMKRFKVVGIYETGNAYNDKTQVFINLYDSDKLFKFNNSISGIEAKVIDEINVQKITLDLNKKFNGKYFITNWIDDHQEFFEAIKMEKVVMNLILLLIIVVAAFNLVSTLVIMVTEKQSDIGVLRAMGASKYDIMRIFMIQGSIIGFLGTFIGLILGLLLASNVTEIVDFIQRQFNYQFISPDVYIIGYVPSHIKYTDVVHICLSALFISFIVTIYPALKAARVQPAEALRYE